MPAARILGASIPLLLLLIAVFGIPWMLRRERRNPSAYSRRRDVLAAWRSMSTAEQQAADDMALGGPARLRQTPEEAELAARQALDSSRRDAAEAAEITAARMAEEITAARMAEAAKRNALFHP